MSKKINSSRLSRYLLPVVVDHLASNYVIGTLSSRVKNRVNTLRADFEYEELDERIFYWENKLSPLDQKTPELAAMPETWQGIQSRLDMVPETTQKQSKINWSSLSFYRWATALSLMLVMVLGIGLVQKPQNTSTETLSYIAVLADDNQIPQVIAATYGKTQSIKLDILTLPKIDDDQTFELWVTSKTDGQSRSLGEIPLAQTSLNRPLTDSEWRLIKDSASLIISVEDEGGSAIGEPSEQVVSSGLCIRLPALEAG